MHLYDLLDSILEQLRSDSDLTSAIVVLCLRSEYNSVVSRMWIGSPVEE